MPTSPTHLSSTDMTTLQTEEASFEEQINMGMGGIIKYGHFVRIVNASSVSKTFPEKEENTVWYFL